MRSRSSGALQSLAQRCEDLAKVDPASLGYAQGMQQITGQEFKHVLDEVNGIYRTALWVRLGWWAWGVQWGVYLLVPLGLVLTFWGSRAFRQPSSGKSRPHGPTLAAVLFVSFIAVIVLQSLCIPGCFG